jgi:hypothetical protein
MNKGVVEFGVCFLNRVRDHAVAGKEFKVGAERTIHRGGVDPQTTQVTDDEAEQFAGLGIESEQAILRMSFEDNTVIQARRD